MNEKKTLPSKTIDADGLKKDTQVTKPDSLLKRILGRLSKQLKEISGDLKVSLKQISQLTKQTEELKVTEHVITELSNRCKELSEQFYEREVLGPVLNCLIGIGDRRRQQIDQFNKLLEVNVDNHTASKTYRLLIDDKKADLVELESMLANFTVERYESHKNTFNPLTQRCISRIPCQNEALHGHIAAHLLPGYKRSGKIIRQECVSVYVKKNENSNL